MTVRSVGRLSTEHLLAWRTASVNKELVELGVVGIGPEEARRYLYDYYRVLGEILDAYELPDNMNHNISTATGGIIEFTLE